MHHCNVLWRVHLSYGVCRLGARVQQKTRGQTTPFDSKRAETLFTCQSIIPIFCHARSTTPECRAYRRSAWIMRPRSMGNGGLRSLEWWYETPVVPLSLRNWVELKRMSREILRVVCASVISLDWVFKSGLPKSIPINVFRDSGTDSCWQLLL